jgi:hypothetical protein
MKKAIALSLSLVCLAALPAAAQNFDWSSAGSAIVLDEGLTNIYDLSGPQVLLKATGVGEIEGRFPVTNTVGSGTNLTPAWNTLTASLVDNHASGWLTITLYKVDKCTATQTPLCQINSSNGANDSVRCETCQFDSGFDFANNAYYIHVLLKKTDTPPAIALYELALN